jgi:hypothetical protein
MQGSLTQIQLPEILQFLSMGKGSGILTLSRGGHEITLFVRNGKIVNSSSIERQRRLGELLIQRGILRRSTLSEVLALQRTVESDKRLGQILVERDIVKEQTIREVLRLQLEEEIWNLFAWEEGEFKFEAAEGSKLGDSIVEIDIEPLILEGTRRMDEWKKIQKTLPDDMVVLTIKQLDDSFKRELKLSPAEWRVLAQVNGRFTIRAVINRAAMGRFETFHILYGFVRKGILVQKAAPKINVGGPESPAPTSSLPKGAPEEVAKTGVGGMLSSLLKGGTAAVKSTTGGKGTLEFVSPAGVLAAFVNEVVAAFLETKEARSGTQEKNFLQRMWRDLVMTFTRADLITVDNNRLNADTLELYFGYFEFAPPIQDTYEDTMEGLFHLLDAIYRMLASRLGERQATKLVREVLSNMSPRVRLRYGDSFNLEERVQNVLKLAA